MWRRNIVFTRAQIPTTKGLAIAQGKKLRKSLLRNVSKIVLAIATVMQLQSAPFFSPQVWLTCTSLLPALHSYFCSQMSTRI